MSVVPGREAKLQKSMNVYRQLPVWKVATRSYTYVWELATLLAIPILIVFLAQLVRQMVPAAMRGAMPLPPLHMILQFAFLNFGFQLIIAIIGMSLAVGVHRMVLLGRSP